MRSEPSKTQGVGEKAAQQFKRDRQDEFLLDELRGAYEGTRHKCDHNKAMFEGCGYEDTSQHSFTIKKCDVCEQEMVVPEQHED
ncbi:MAG: hypothetical protein HN745_26920 [Deltaproteobacteria bacterium]|jgi:hypothetical protein|nr:hypothetical protein [Deltaproteobacteria bacterium]